MKVREFVKKTLNIEKVKVFWSIKNIENEDFFQCFLDMKPQKRIFIFFLHVFI